jgi:hypothetical protein
MLPIFAPPGPTRRTLNKLADDISYYVAYALVYAESRIHKMDARLYKWQGNMLMYADAKSREADAVRQMTIMRRQRNYGGKK